MNPNNKTGYFPLAYHSIFAAFSPYEKSAFFQETKDRGIGKKTPCDGGAISSG
jgi:hypothetical protein